ncbi:MAG: hypothetical protein H8E84_08850 [Flavobacteriales bacterium]|nr:hypothetical protein [Flavobacteriales bacterium]
MRNLFLSFLSLSIIVSSCKKEEINELFGCTDYNAANYSNQAIQDDGSCYYIYGCTDPDAINYNPNATTDVTYSSYNTTNPIPTNKSTFNSDYDGICEFEGTIMFYTESSIVLNSGNITIKFQSSDKGQIWKQTLSPDCWESGTVTFKIPLGRKKFKSFLGSDFDVRNNGYFWTITDQNIYGYNSSCRKNRLIF